MITPTSGVNTVRLLSLTSRREPSRRLHRPRNTMIRNRPRQCPTRMPLGTITLRLIIVVELPLGDEATLPHSLVQRSFRVARCPSAAGDLPRVMEQNLCFGLACALRRAWWRRTGLRWFDGVLNVIVVGHATAMFPIHWVVVAGKTAAVAIGKMCLLVAWSQDRWEVR